MPANSKSMKISGWSAATKALLASGSP
jgi:hypothetical protein